MTFETVRDTLAEQFEIDPSEITMDTNLIDDIGADSLYYLSLESLYKASGRSMEQCQLCTACFNGDYPTNLYAHEQEKC